MSEKLTDLDETILELKQKISQDPDPFLLEELEKLYTIRANQIDRLLVDAQGEAK